MMRYALIALVSLALAGCETIGNFTKERYARNNDRGRAWLSDQVLPPEINVTGTWKSDSWGGTFLAQTGQVVRGHLGDYPVEGVVSGRKAYLLASESGWYYYSVVLEMPGPDVLIGYYSRSVPYKSGRRHDIRLDRAP